MTKKGKKEHKDFLNYNFLERICIAIEVGIQSGTLAIAITAGLLNNPDLAIPAIVYSLWMYVSAFIAVYCGRKKVALAKWANRVIG